MAYQVLARKWRPQRLDDVIGQRGVTQTLRNAIARGRLAQAFVFAGPRGVGKTTTARILARALNCVEGPTPDPCGECDVCREVAEGRDIDVLEIDAATHTQVDNVREVIISGLSIAPVRDRYKVFIIDEVHQLSSSSFNALLKSVEEPPPHVVFIMATTLLDKIPDTILSRSQVFEFRTIGTAAIAEQLRTIVAAEEVSVDEAGLALVARTANGSMRDAQSALDQVIAFAGDSAGADDVSAVLGLVGRDAVLEMAETVAAEAAERVFDLAGRFVEAGYDLRSVCRELARLVRDLMVLKVDARRIGDPEIALDAERDRLQALVDRFSREDLLRGFDVLSRAELDIRNATQPRYHFEMAMLRWIHLRALVPLADLLGGAGRLDAAPSGAAPVEPPRRARPAPQVRRTAASPAPARPEPSPGPPPAPSAPAHPEPSPGPPAGRSPAAAAPAPPTGSAAGLKERFLAELQRTRKFFHGTVAAQAREIEVENGRIAFVFTTAQRTLAQQVEKNRSWLEPLAGQVAGRKTAVTVRQVDGPAPPSTRTASGESGPDPRQPALTTLPPEPPPPTEPPADLDLSSDPEPPSLGSPVRSEPPSDPGPSPLGPPVRSGVPSAAERPADRAPSLLGSPVRSEPPSLGSPVRSEPPSDPGPSSLGPPVRSGAPSATERPADRAPSPLGPPVRSEPPSQSEGAETADAPPVASAPSLLGSPVQSGSPPPPGPPAPLGSPVRSGSPPPGPPARRATGLLGSPVRSGSAAPPSEKADDLLSQAMGDPAVQTMLDVFPAEIKDVEEM